MATEYIKIERQEAASLILLASACMDKTEPCSLVDRMNRVMLLERLVKLEKLVNGEPISELEQKTGIKLKYKEQELPFTEKRQ